ncbi:MAG: TolC family protein [Bacteroidaceae bacterium]|nr:TolC family protein [Bacteroidaceae bacterium]
MKKFVVTLFAALSFAGAANAQLNNDGTNAGYFDSSDLGEINYSSFKLPPLGVLFENAKSNPQMELLLKDEQLERELLKKQQKAFLNFINGYGSYSYGNSYTINSNTDTSTPIYSSSNKGRNAFWGIGASVNINLGTLFDLKGSVSRQRLAVEKASLQREQAYNEMKQRIATLYVEITNSLVSLKTSAENAAAYKGAGELTNEEFKSGEVSVRDLASTKKIENEAIREYQLLQSKITTDILTLEILTSTPIITNVTSQIKINK